MLMALFSAAGVALLSVAMTLNGLAVVMTARWVWHVGLVFGAVVIGGVLYGAASMYGRVDFGDRRIVVRRSKGAKDTPGTRC